jgi:hypothetical protein
VVVNMAFRDSALFAKLFLVTPAKAGVQLLLAPVIVEKLDSRFRGNDGGKVVA